MDRKTRRFGTQGRVYPEDNYVVPRTAEVADFINRVKQGRYIVLFAPRQTGKTTFFQLALDELAVRDSTYVLIQLNFETYEDCTRTEFYDGLTDDVCEKITDVFQKRGQTLPKALSDLLETAQFTNHLSLRQFLKALGRVLVDRRVVLIIDEFDAIPRDALKGFLRVLRDIYLSGRTRCPHSVGIIGVKDITQLDYDRSISPFNIQDEFHLPNFTVEQVCELFAQYTDEVGQAFDPEVIRSIHRQTAGQPFLVNRFAQVLTEKMDIPKNDTIAMTHFSEAHAKIREEDNPNLTHLLTNIHRDPRFKNILMEIVSYERGVRFNPRREIINQLATYGVIGKGPDGMCQIVNPIYQYCILQAFKPEINGLEEEYLPDSTDFLDYLTSTGQINMELLLDNFRAFIARAGFRILQVPETPKEYVGQDLLYAYLDQFVSLIGGAMYLEAQTGRGRMDLVIFHNTQKYIVETKIWEGPRSYQAGKKQLAAYLQLEGAVEGYYIVFDHREQPEPRTETEVVDGTRIRSYVIPVMQKRPSQTF